MRSTRAKATLISYGESQEIREARKKRRREELVTRLVEIEEIEELADKTRREAIDELAAEGKLILKWDLE